MRDGRRTGSPQWRLLLPAVLALFATIGCVLGGRSARVGELVTNSETVELGDAQSADVEIFMAAGELTVSGGASELMEADFTYNVDELTPEVEYSGGTLTVRTPDTSVGLGSLGDLDDYRNEWDLLFNSDVPMNMRVEVAAGTADLELGDLSLTALDVRTGASEARLDLSDSSSLSRLNVDAGVGETTLDLTGTWQDDLDADISNGVGELILRLPVSVCVRVEVEAGIGDVVASGLTKDGNTYVNNACGESDVTLHIDIRAGVGTVDLEVVE